jgi:hypothetical protein
LNISNFLHALNEIFIAALGTIVEQKKIILTVIFCASVLLIGCSPYKRLEVVTPVRVSGTEVKIRDAYVLPGDHVKAGEEVTLIVDYIVIAPLGTQEAEIEERMVLTKDGKLVKLLYEGLIKRIVGKCIAKVRFLVPKTAKHGSYVIKNTVKAGTSYDVYDAFFEVSNSRSGKKRR